jgi:hypothetical protein
LGGEGLPSQPLQLFFEFNMVQMDELTGLPRAQIAAKPVGHSRIGIKIKTNVLIYRLISQLRLLYQNGLPILCQNRAC